MSSNNALSAYIGGIQRFSTEDGPGIRTTVFLKGCPLKCEWCHNPELINFGADLLYSINRCIKCGSCSLVCPQQALTLVDDQVLIDRESCNLCMSCALKCPAKALRSAAIEMTVDEVMAEVMKDNSFYKESGGGLTISGGEMLSQPEFSYALLKAAKESGINVALDTSGYGNSDTLHLMAQACDYILYDIKTSQSVLHKKLVGKSNTLILHNLKILASDLAIASKIVIRMPLINGINDSLDDIKTTRDLMLMLNLKKVTLLPYHDLGLAKSKGLGVDVKKFSSPDKKHLHTIAELFQSVGIDAAIGGENE